MCDTVTPEVCSGTWNWTDIMGHMLLASILLWLARFGKMLGVRLAAENVQPRGHFHQSHFDIKTQIYKQQKKFLDFGTWEE